MIIKRLNSRDLLCLLFDLNLTRIYPENNHTKKVAVIERRLFTQYIVYRNALFKKYLHLPETDIVNSQYNTRKPVFSRFTGLSLLPTTQQLW